MLEKTNFYINGTWVAPLAANPHPVINPANEEPFAHISLGGAADLDRAVSAARAAFDSWSHSSRETRIAHLARLRDIYARRSGEMAETISREMGAPITMSNRAQAGTGAAHIDAFIRETENFEFERSLRPDLPDEHISYEPIGVCALITPWNWPMNQITLKVIPALATGCTVILKPSEISPLSAMLFAEYIDEAGFPPGVFNLVNGDGQGVGEAMSAHPDIDMISFTGSTRGGIAVTKGAADTVKRVTLELGGKGPNIILQSRDVAAAARRNAAHCFNNSGQSCNAPTRMLVSRDVYEEAVTAAAETAAATSVGPPDAEGRHIGPLASSAQFDKVQRMIRAGIDEGARLVAGGPGRPEGFNRGYYVRPTVFADVDNAMTVAKEEIFGPVLSIIPFDTEEEAIRIANATPYGLTSYVQCDDRERARSIARRLRTGMVQMNGAMRPPGSPFGGMKQSGNGREGGRWGLEDYLEIKAISGWETAEPA